MDPTHLSARLDRQALNHCWFPHRDSADDGSAKVIEFPPRNATWIRFQVTESKGHNIGLEEFEIHRSAGR